MLIFCKRACTGGFFKYNKSYIPINLCWSYKFNTLCYLQATFYVIRSICEYYITVKCGNCKNISVCFIRTSTVEIVYPRLYFALAKPSLFNAISSIYKPYLCRIVRISSVSKKKKLGGEGIACQNPLLASSCFMQRSSSSAMKQSIKAQIALVSQSTAGQRLFALGIISIIAVEVSSFSAPKSASFPQRYTLKI